MLAPQLITKLDQRITKLLEDCSVINAAVVTTADGHIRRAIFLLELPNSGKYLFWKEKSVCRCFTSDASPVPESCPPYPHLVLLACSGSYDLATLLRVA